MSFDVSQLNLHDLNALTILIRMGLAILIGGIIGLERGMQNHQAGLRTYILVCLGAAIIMMTNQYVTVVFDTGDPTRMGAQVISGIGFLGAGTIITTSRNRVRGLTTAAGLWVAGALGLAIGIGFYSLAIAGGAAILLVMTTLRPLKRVIRSHNGRVDCYITTHPVAGLNHFLDYCADLGVHILDMQIENEYQLERVEDEEIVYFVSLDLNNKIPRDAFIQKVSSLTGVLNFEELDID